MEKDILEKIYEKYMRQVYLYLYSLCHSHSLSEDLTQETFLRAFCSLEIAGDEMLPWLLTVARNLYLDNWRREKRHRKLTEEEKRHHTGNGKAEEGGGEILAQLIQKEQNQRLYRAVQELKETEKEAVILYYFAGLPQEEIGRLLGLTYGNTRVLLYRAKRRLKEILNREEEKGGHEYGI